MRLISLPLLLTGCAILATGSPGLAQQPPPLEGPVHEPVPAPSAPAVILPAPLTPAEAPTPSIPAVWAPAPRDAEGRTAYGLYLSGRAAVRQGEGGTGARYLGAAESLTPEQPVVREQAFTAALLAGDLDDAARIAPSGGDVSPVIGEAGRLVAAVQIFARGDAREALARLKTPPIAAPHARAAVFVQPWIAAAAGDWDVALLQPTSGAMDNVSQIMRYHRAQLLEGRRLYPEADAEYLVLMQRAGNQPMFRLGYGAFLERRGRRDEAVALYDVALAAPAADPQMRRARDRAASRDRPPALASWRQGAASALTTAAAFASGDGADEFAAVYLRLALNVAPSDESRLLLGATLAKAGLESAAREAFEGVAANDAEAYAAARAQIAASLSRQDRAEDALAEFRRAATAAPTNPRVAYFLASQLVALNRHDEALTLLNGPVLDSLTQGPEIRFIRGAAYESLNRIPEAEAELWAALQARPDDPAFLNYLGYLWVDSGTRVAEGAAMIARAHAADPQDGNIQDSLGWAQYRQGQYEIAVGTLEEAVAKEPANAEINDHLGDAYWQVGRRREAGFQWYRVLTLDPDADRRAEVEKKLAEGLSSPTPVSSGSQP